MVQLHFHAPSEHTIDGKYFDLEMHIVHTYSETQYLVLGFFFDMEEGGPETNDFIESVGIINLDDAKTIVSITS